MKIIPVTTTIGTRRSLWGEGPVWWENHLWYTDIEAHTVIQLNPATGEEKSWPTAQRIGFLSPRSQGGFLIGGDHGISAFDPHTRTITPLIHPEPNQPDNRFNDGKSDPAGRLFAGTISLTKKTGTAQLFRISPDLTYHPIYQPVTTSNGLDWSAENDAFYYIDTPTRRVIRFDYDITSGEISHPTPIINTSDIDASPDGMTIDNEGFLWIAFCHGACVRRYDPTTGQIDTELKLPVMEVTSLTFGGPNLETLFITTGKHKTIVETDAGAVFSCQPGVAGRHPHPFAG